MKRSRRHAGYVDPIREATIGTLKHVVDHLITLMFDTGVTVQELNYLVRDRAVRTATKRVIKECGRNNKSRVAIMTGVPRSEVSRILVSFNNGSRPPFVQGSARRVLDAWYDNPRFLADSGEPAELPIFGKRRTFEELVSRYGTGLPVRAMLDELAQIDAVECLPQQRVRAKARVPIHTGLTTNAVSAIGERCNDLLQTLMSNLRRPAPPLFEATALAYDIDPEMVPVVRRELAAQGASFINGANALLKRSRNKSAAVSSTHQANCRLGVSVYYFEPERDSDNSDRALKAAPRRNLRRRQPEKIQKEPAKTRRRIYKHEQ